VTVELVNTIIFVLFLALLVAGAVTTLIRKVALDLKRFPAPRLLPRDVALLTLLSVSFLLISMSRVFGWSPYVVGQVWWSLVTGIPAILAVAVYLYFELFVIGQPEDWRVVVRTMLRRLVP
jgi:hypothetical protein